MGGLSAFLKAFEFRLCKIEGVADRLASLRAYRDHFANRASRHHLRADIRRGGGLLKAVYSHLVPSGSCI
jgi:hypothetical protein